MKGDLPPHNLDAERAVLGGVMFDPESIVKIKPTLDVEDFYSHNHQRIYAAMLDVYEDGLDCDVVSIAVCLTNKNELAKIGGHVYLSTLCDTVPSAANIESHARIVKEKAILRRIMEQARAIIDQAVSPGVDIDQIPTRLSITSQKDISVKHISGIMQQLDKNINAGYPGLLPCYDILARTIRRTFPGHMWVVGAWTSVGKSAWLVDFICRTYRLTASNPGIAIFSTEMSSEQYLIRCLSNETMISGWRITENRLLPNQQDAVCEAKSSFNTRNLYIYDNLYRIEEIERAARMIKEGPGLDILAIDYIQNLWGDGSIYERMSRLAPILQYLAKELQITIIALSQVSNQHARGDTGGLINYKGAGEIAASADLGIELEREKDNKDRMKFIVKKNRHGRIAEGVLEYINDYTRLLEVKEDGEVG